MYIYICIHLYLNCNLFDPECNMHYLVNCNAYVCIICIGIN